jgi:hypothetical protein
MPETAPDPTTPPPTAKAADLGPLAKWAIGIGLSFLIGFLGARYGIAPVPAPPIPQLSAQSAPQPIVIVVGAPAGATATPAMTAK